MKNTLEPAQNPTNAKRSKSRGFHEGSEIFFSFNFILYVLVMGILVGWCVFLVSLVFVGLILFLVFFFGCFGFMVVGSVVWCFRGSVVVLGCGGLGGRSGRCWGGRWFLGLFG